MTRNVIYCAVLLSLLACQRQDTDDVLKPNLGVPPTIESTPEPTVTEEMKEAEREAQKAIQDSENEFEYFYRERLGQEHLRKTVPVVTLSLIDPPHSKLRSYHRHFFLIVLPILGKGQISWPYLSRM